MSKVVDHLAELTGFRDRDVLDTTLAGALRDLLEPQRVAIHRCVGEESSRRWLTRARLAADEAAATADPLWVEFDSLPRLAEFPARVAAIDTHEPVNVPGTPHVTIFPLFTDRDVAGVVELESVAPLDVDQLRLVVSILRIYRNFQSLLDYSERDTLTGLLNRKTFDEAFYKLSSQPAEDNTAPAGERRVRASTQAHFIGVLDIDHFKSVNDRYGHLIGDEVLLLLSRLMRSCFRYHDRLYRFGGEEFVVMMRCASDADAGRAFERLRASVASYQFPQVGNITVSVGYTVLKPGDTPSSAFERADKAVYWAKTHGRNQVCSHADLIARGELADDSKVGDVELF
ncbi:GGDEF domain-containing protein [Aquincola sp. S2]|uniref:diguanylate cyclase n=1 Tax=Pseudaquabacterium terrae TaxID=2732868 RepID=A0ABX2EDG6_9BURK|nr:GGDEF domain-containing protein [Aquabacterium terrae]NRF66747.1 GGDEF domain-containing protein [Aquabacterium terrae]